MPDDKEVARRRMALCTRRSDEAGDPPCWQALPDDYAARDCEAGCLRDASATVENGSPMPDDAIERAHWSRQSIAGIVIQAIVASRSGKGMALPAGRAADEILTLLAPAFASQQAPEGWRERVRPYLQHRLPCRTNLRMGARECTCGLSAMLDAAPSVTLGEVG